MSLHQIIRDEIATALKAGARTEIVESIRLDAVEYADAGDALNVARALSMLAVEILGVHMPLAVAAYQAHNLHVYANGPADYDYTAAMAWAACQPNVMYGAEAQLMKLMRNMEIV